MRHSLKLYPTIKKLYYQIPVSLCYTKFMKHEDTIPTNLSDNKACNVECCDRYLTKIYGGALC